MKTRNIIGYILFFLTLISCAENNKKESSLNTLLEKDTLTQDSLIYEKYEFYDKIVESFNVHEYIEKSNKSFNSGVVKRRDFHYFPDTLGYYYNFYEIISVLVNDGVSKDTITEQYEERIYIDLIVFNCGKNTDSFNLQKSILIELFCTKPDKYLGKLNLVNESIEKVIEYFKTNKYIGNHYIFQTRKIALICEINERTNRISSFRIIRINEKKEIDDLIEKIAAHNSR